jgi:hypothetical protein
LASGKLPVRLQRSSRVTIPRRQSQHSELSVPRSKVTDRPELAPTTPTALCRFALTRTAAIEWPVSTHRAGVFLRVRPSHASHATRAGLLQPPRRRAQGERSRCATLKR